MKRAISFILIVFLCLQSILTPAMAGKNKRFFLSRSSVEISSAESFQKTIPYTLAPLSHHQPAGGLSVYLLNPLPGLLTFLKTVTGSFFKGVTLRSGYFLASVVLSTVLLIGCAPAPYVESTIEYPTTKSLRMSLDGWANLQSAHSIAFSLVSHLGGIPEEFPTEEMASFYGVDLSVMVAAEIFMDTAGPEGLVELGWKNILEAIDSSREKGAVYFVRNALIPYLGLLKHGIGFGFEPGTPNFEKFKTQFKNHFDDLSPFMDLHHAVQETGQVATDDIEAFNPVLGKKGLLLKKSQDGYGIAFHAFQVKKTYPINLPKIDGTLIESINIIIPFANSYPFVPGGFYQVGDDTTYLLGNNISDIVVSFSNIISGNDPKPLYFDPSSGRLWKEMGMDLTLREANELYTSIVLHTFPRGDRQEIQRAATIWSGLQELKHAFEAGIPPVITNTIDAEISGHLIEAIEGPDPFVPLIRFLGQMELFILEVDYDETVKGKLISLTTEVWSMLRKMNREGWDSDKGKEKAIGIYEQYQTIAGGHHFHPLDSFRPIANKFKKAV